MVRKSNFELPMGIVFDPSGEQSLKYLILKMNGSQLPWNGIDDVDLYHAAPWVVFEDGISAHRHCWHVKDKGRATKATAFFFTKLTRVPNSKRISRTAGGGTWSGKTGPKKIFSSETGKEIGVVRMLSFDIDSAPPGSGHWIMHEYSLNETNGAAADLVLCKITRSVKNNSGRELPWPSPVIANGGISQIPASKAAAEECSFQESKVQYSSPAIAWAEDEMISFKEEKPGNGVGTFSEVAAPTLLPHGSTAEADEGIDELLNGRGGCDTAQGAAFPKGEDSFSEYMQEEEVVDDSWLVSALDQDGNVEILRGGYNSGLTEAAEESRVQEVQKTARCIEHYSGDHQQPPQPQFFPPAAVHDVQETGSKRAAEESSVQEVHETVCKKQKSCDGDNGSGLTEAEKDANVKLPYGGFSDKEEFAEAVTQSDLWQTTGTAMATPLGFDDFDDNFDVGLLW